jgi:hypothetical protein
MSTVPVRIWLGPAYSRRVPDLRGPRPLRATAVGLLVGTALLTGCSQRTEANDTLPPTSSGPTSEALPPVGPADFPVPDEARTKDAAGAEAFLRYYIDLSNRQQTLLEGQPLRDVGPQCQECLRIAQNFDEAAAASYRYEGGELTINELAPPLVEGDTAVISFDVQQEAVRLLDADGNPVYPGLEMQPELSSGIELVWGDDKRSWLVKAFSLG